ncbi:MAG: hypothetical protein HYV09_29905 [Deltaproteobacteria bacterium]|nr:hypothetical protein [Deltaproteobacteria bacterium]
MSRPIEITYKFHLPDGRDRVHLVQLRRETLALEPDPAEPPAWTALDQNKCRNCTLEARTTPFCPPARAVAAVADHFKDAPSHTVTRTEVITEDRTYGKQCSLAEALGSLFGLVMATSGCPQLDFLRPMARFHLPFASVEETIVRATSFHLLRQYHRAKRGWPESLGLEVLAERYHDVTAVNQGLAQRIRAIGGKDSGRNAVVALDVFAKMLQMELRDELPILDELFPDDDRPATSSGYLPVA